MRRKKASLGGVGTVSLAWDTNLCGWKKAMETKKALRWGKAIVRASARPLHRASS